MNTTDYVDFTYYEMPKSERRLIDVGDIFLNQVRCRQCNWIIRSKNRHDYVSCKCGSTTVDGGSWYSKTSGLPDWVGIYYADAVAGIPQEEQTK